MQEVTQNVLIIREVEIWSRVHVAEPAAKRRPENVYLPFLEIVHAGPAAKRKRREKDLLKVRDWERPAPGARFLSSEKKGNSYRYNASRAGFC